MERHHADAPEQTARRPPRKRPACPQSIFWVLRSGAPWRDLPETDGPCTTCYNRFVRWRRTGVWDQIMVGTGTVVADDPQLTCRLPGLDHRSPVRVVIDRHLRIPPAARLITDARRIPTCLLTLRWLTRRGARALLRRA